jgi:hypothetical protein
MNLATVLEPRLESKVYSLLWYLFFYDFYVHRTVHCTEGPKRSLKNHNTPFSQQSIMVIFPSYLHRMLTRFCLYSQPMEYLGGFLQCGQRSLSLDIIVPLKKTEKD